MMLNALAPVAVHTVPVGLLLHGWAGSATDTVKGPAARRSVAFRRRRAPVEVALVVVVVVEVAGSGKRILI